MDWLSELRVDNSSRKERENLGDISVLVYLPADTNVKTMKHSEWRKIAKKARRKRIRQHQAELRHQLEQEEQRRREGCADYKVWLEEQDKAEQLHAKLEATLAAERELQWRKVEKEAQRQWQALQEKLAAAREERARQNEQIKLEWEREQQRQKLLKEQKERELQEALKQQELLDQKVNDFLENGGDTPEHLKTERETNPSKPICPFFQKTSSCRFYDVCSRNHVRPGISRILLILNFFTDYSLEATENEHGSDASLEFENYETYNHYKEFFYDVIPELETFGTIKLFKTCCNHEPHLRGNVYVEYSTTNSALKCYKVLNGRWYGGKQLNVEFCKIKSWRTAICGLYFVKRCPKGNSCNFLHVFRNPKNLYNDYEDQNRRTMLLIGEIGGGQNLQNGYHLETGKRVIRNIQSDEGEVGQNPKKSCAEIDSHNHLEDVEEAILDHARKLQRSIRDKRQEDHQGDLIGQTEAKILADPANVVCHIENLGLW
ncbi:hypothetical protein NQ318_008767, partial [Aromia moschata]